jgi:hypothetical protein
MIELEMEESITVTHQQKLRKENRDTVIIVILSFLTTLWTFLLTVIPVLANIPSNNYYVGHTFWFTGNDVMRLIEPISFLVYFYIFHTEYIKRPNVLHLITFLLGSYIFIEGATLHSSSNMFKNAFETMPSTNNTIVNIFITDLENWFETVWEHEIGHYLYGVGLAILFALTAWVHRYEITVISTKIIRLFVILTVIVRSLLIAGACIEFPLGTVVGLIYLILANAFSIGYTIGWCNTSPINLHNKKSNILISKAKLFIQIENRPIWMTFLYGYIGSLIILIIWIGIHGFKSRVEAGL